MVNVAELAKLGELSPNYLCSFMSQCFLSCILNSTLWVPVEPHTSKPMVRLPLLSDRSFLPVSTYDSIIHSPWPRTNVTPFVMPESIPSFCAFSLNILCTTLRTLSTVILPAVSVHGCPITTGKCSLGTGIRSYSSSAPSKVSGTSLAFGKWMNEWMNEAMKNKRHWSEWKRYQLL